MTTKLTIKGRSQYESMQGDKTYIQASVDGDDDNMKWRLEQFCRFLLAEGFLELTIKKYLNYEDGEVWELDDKLED